MHESNYKQTNSLIKKTQKRNIFQDNSNTYKRQQTEVQEHHFK